MGDKFEMSGDFRGAIVNIKSTLTNSQQSIGDIQTNDEETRQELTVLVEQLSQALEETPPDRTEEAAAVAQTADALIQQATAKEPNQPMLKISGEGLKLAAKNIADALPAVLGIATQIVLAVGKLTTAG